MLDLKEREALATTERTTFVFKKKIKTSMQKRKLGRQWINMNIINAPTKINMYMFQFNFWWYFNQFEIEFRQIIISINRTYIVTTNSKTLCPSQIIIKNMHACVTKMLRVDTY